MTSTTARHAEVARPRARRAAGPAVLAVLLALAVVGPLVAPFGISELDLGARLQPPVLFGGTTEHPLGTDNLGRDVLSRVLAGGRNSLLIAASVVLIAGTVGTAVGVLAGFRRGVTEALIMRWAEVQIAVPGLVLALVVLRFLGSNVLAVVLVLSAIYWMLFAQVARSSVLSIASSGFVDAAWICGTQSRHIMTRHILPHLVQPITLLMVLEFSKVMLSEATLAFLGVGIQPPDASWGGDIAVGRQYVTSGWWLVVMPGAALTFSVLGIHVVGNWLRTIVGPGSRPRARSPR